jgi:ATP-dependent helicase/nuclease subunit A
MSRGHDPRAISAAAQRRAAAPDRSAWVAASAGTGKTKVLIDRLLTLLLAGARPQRLLCLTFTKAAAQEMALRLANILRDWATISDGEKVGTLGGELHRLTGTLPDNATKERARRLFAEVLDAPGGLRIDTIHAFCQSLLRRFPLEARLPPNFQVLDERSAAELLQDCQDAMLADAREDESGDLARALSAVTARAGEHSFGELLGALMAERGRLKQLIGGRDGLRRAIARLNHHLRLSPGDTVDSLIRNACRDAEINLAGLRRAVQALQGGSTTDRKRGDIVAQWLADVAARPGSFEAYCRAYFTDKNERFKHLVTKATLLAAPGIDEVLATEAARLEQVVERCNAARNATGTAALLRLGDAIEKRYAAAKADRAALDYDDLILATRDLLRRPGVAPWVLYKLDGGIDHILIDEAQDTNPEQWEVIEALAGEFFVGETGRAVERTLFAVGDVKQSIYSFQRADPQAFVDLRRAFEARARDTDRKWQNEELIVSFRSTEAVLAAVDAVFAQPPAARGVALDGAPIRHETVRAGEGGLVELWPPVVPREREAPAPWAPPVERTEEDSPRARLARLIAETVAGWIERKEPLESHGRPIRAEDVLILVRRRNALVDLLVRELKKAGVGVAGIDRMVLADQLAVMDLIALGRFLLLPDDDLTLATVLKGPLFGFSEERLFELAHGRRRPLWPELRARASENDEFARAVRELSELLARADFVRPYDLFAEVLGARGGRQRIVARLGLEANDPLDEFLAASLSFERRHPPALETFLHWLEAGREEVKRDLESRARHEVRVMTVHGAKGLQSPIVILPDTLQVPRAGPKLLWLSGAPEEPDTLLWSPETKRDDSSARSARDAFVNGQLAEYRRLLYVAMTRAEDRLYVCGYEDRRGPQDGCWHHLVRNGLATADGVERFEMTGEAAGQGLRLRSAQRRSAEPQPIRAAPAAAALPGWWEHAPPDEPDPPRPLVPSHPEGEEPPVRGPFDADDTTRFRRGRLIHRLLQTLPDLPSGDREAAARRFLARPAHRLDAAAQEAIVRETLAVIAHPAWAELFGPDSVAEAPIVGRVGTRLLSGQIDRVVVTAGEVRIIDYKTNRPPPLKAADVPPIYLRQMAAYRAVLAAVCPGRRVRCALLWTDGPSLLELPEDLLARYAP